MKASDYIARHLAARGVSHVFELVGGMTTHMIDSIDRLGASRIVTVRHEQAASFAADAYGRITGVPGVALATSGPGAVNLLTGMGGCHFDSSPAVFLTGQVNRDEQKGDRAIRQLGFQETDVVAMAAPITKAAWHVERPEDVPSILDRAFALALEGRPGPVLVDIPMDVQRGDRRRRARPRPPSPIRPRRPHRRGRGDRSPGRGPAAADPRRRRRPRLGGDRGIPGVREACPCAGRPFADGGRRTSL